MAVKAAGKRQNTRTAVKRRNVRTNKIRRFDQQRVKTMKLAAMMMIILLAFSGLSYRLYTITRDNNAEYQKRILSQQRYDSTTLPFKRGTITDRNGTILAVSEKVYNVILDCKVMLDDEKNQEPTVSALVECFGLSSSELNSYIQENPNSQYYVLKKRITYDEMSPFLERQSTYNAETAKYNAKAKKEEKRGVISGVWFEEEYIRRYPNNALACDVIGFTGTDNNGTYGLEEYYNDTLNGTNGREYGYLNEDATLERTTVAAVDGNSLVSTMDANIQAICEKYLKQFSDEHANEAREGLGFENAGIIAMNPNNGEILAMASYPNFDLNNPKDLSAYYTQEQIDAMNEEDTYYDALNKLWRNFCISDTYEPGSTAKSLTLAAGLESGKIIGNESYECGGSLTVADHDISCNVKQGHGTLDVAGALEQSCNVAFMKMGEAIGVKNTVKFENIFNIGLKTNIDLAGEARTASLVYSEDTMGPAELATCSFGQGFNVTMIEMACAFSSIINGGYYYEPHMVSKITNSSGSVVKNIEPRVIKQTISNTTSEQMRNYLYLTVAEGTGKSARPAGYAIGGKTGTAEMVPRDHKNYVVSFIGFAPADDPQIVIYCVIDRPNVADQPHATYATGIVKSVLTEVLPYMHIATTEEMTIAEQEEMDHLLENMINAGKESAENAENGDGEAGDGGENSGNENGENGSDEGSENKNGENGSNENGENGSNEGDNASTAPRYTVDPNTGELIDTETGEFAQVQSSFENGNGDNTDNTGNSDNSDDTDTANNPAGSN